MGADTLEFVGAALVIGGAFLPGFNVISTKAGFALRVAGYAMQHYGQSMRVADEEQQGSKLNYAGSESPLPVVYGETRVGGSIVDVRTRPTTGETESDDPIPNRKLDVVLAVAVGSEDGSGVEDIGDIYLDGELAIPRLIRDENDNLVENTDGLAISHRGVSGEPTPGNPPLMIEGYDENEIEVTGRFEERVVEFTVPGSGSRKTTVYGDGVADGFAFTNNNGRNKMSLVRATKYLGTDSQTVPNELNDSYPLEWPTESRLRGIAYVHLELLWTTNNTWGGIPNVEVTIRGNKCYDPRNESTKWTENPALALRDYLTSVRYGAGIPEEEIDDTSVQEEANYLDEVVTVYDPLDSGTQFDVKRGMIGGWISTAETLENNIENLLFAMRGSLIYQNGIYRMHSTKAELPVDLKLTPENIVGDWSFSRSGIEGAPNKATISFADRLAEYEIDEVHFPAVGEPNPWLEVDNGYVRELNLNLRLVPDELIAYNIGQVVFLESRNDVTISVTCLEEALQLEIGDVVEVTHPTPGYVEKEFIVEDMAVSPDSLVRLSLREYREDAYDLDPSTSLPRPPGTDLPNPFVVPPPENFELFSSDETALETQDGNFVPRILASWDIPEDNFISGFEVQYREIDDEEEVTEEETQDISSNEYEQLPMVTRDTTFKLFGPVTAGVNHEVRCRAVNNIGRKSDWVNGTIVADTEPGDAQIQPYDRTKLIYGTDDDGDQVVDVVLTIDDPFDRLRDTAPVIYYKHPEESFEEEGAVSELPEIDFGEPDPEWQTKEPEASGDFEGSWVFRLPVDEKHLALLSYVFYWDTFGGEENFQQRILWIDVGDQANIIDTNVSYDSEGLATIRVKGDADTKELGVEERTLPETDIDVTDITELDSQVRSDLDSNGYETLFDLVDAYVDDQVDFLDDLLTFLDEDDAWDVFDYVDDLLWSVPTDIDPTADSRGVFFDRRRGKFSTMTSEEGKRFFRVYGFNRAGERGPDEELEIDERDTVLPPGEQNFVRMDDYIWALEGDPTQQPNLFLEIGGATRSLRFEYTYRTNEEPDPGVGIEVDYIFETPESSPRSFPHDLRDESFTSGQGNITPLELTANGEIDNNRIVITAYDGPNGTGDSVEREFVFKAWGQLTTQRVLFDGTNFQVNALEIGSGLSFAGSVLQTDIDPPDPGDTIVAGDGINAIEVSGGTEVSVDNTVVRTTRSINTGNGLLGGGDLSEDRTIFVNTNEVAMLGTNQTFVGQKSFNSTTFFNGDADFRGHVELSQLDPNRSAGRLYSGTTDPVSTTRTNYDGNFWANELYSRGSFRISDLTMKEQVDKWIADSLIDSLEPIKWNWADTGEEGYGFGAQDVPEVFRNKESMSINYDRITTALVYEVKRLKEKIRRMSDGVE